MIIRLPVVSVAAFAIAFAAMPAVAQDHGAHGHPSPGAAGAPAAPKATAERTVIALDDAERAFVLAEMRAFLESVEGIVDAVASGKPAAAAKAATASGPRAMQAAPMTLMAKLPGEFRMLGMDTHKKFEAIAQEASGMGDPKAIMKGLSEALANCTACHRAFAFAR